MPPTGSRPPQPQMCGAQGPGCEGAAAQLAVRSWKTTGFAWPAQSPHRLPTPKPLRPGGALTGTSHPRTLVAQGPMVLKLICLLRVLESLHHPLQSRSRGMQSRSGIPITLQVSGSETTHTTSDPHHRTAPGRQAVPCGFGHTPVSHLRLSGAAARGTVSRVPTLHGTRQRLNTHLRGAHWGGAASAMPT